MQIHRDRKQNRGYQGLGGGEYREEEMGSYCLMDTELLFGMMKSSRNG